MKHLFRIYLLSVCLFSSALLNAQFNHGSIALGFNAGKTTLDIFKYTYNPATNNSPITFTNQQAQTFKNRAIHFGLEEINSKFYIFAGANLHFMNQETDTTGNTANKEYVFFKTAYGWNIAKVVSLMVGAQYHFSRFEIEGIDKPYAISSTGIDFSKKTDIHFDYFGGHHYGINLNLLIMPTDFICLRASLFINKVTMSGIPGNVKYQDLKFSGSAISPEFALYLYPGGDKNYGLKLSYTYTRRNISATQNSEKTFIPDNTSTATNFNVSILIKAPWHK